MNQKKLKRALWLAFQASIPMGMGHLHSSSASEQTEDSLYKSVNPEGKDKFYTDYVFGRMMKTGFEIENEKLKINPETPRLDYQSWGSMYHSADSLIFAVEQSLN